MEQTPVLLCIDIQKEYVTPQRPFCIENISSSLENGKEVLAHARANGWTVYHVKHLQEGSIFNADSPYSDFVDGFLPGGCEAVFHKSDFSCYSSKECAEALQSNLGRKVYVIGYGSTMCCLSTIVDGYHRGQKFCLVGDASYAKATARHGEATLHEHLLDIITPFAEVVSAGDLLNP